MADALANEGFRARNYNLYIAMRSSNGSVGDAFFQKIKREYTLVDVFLALSSEWAFGVLDSDDLGLYLLGEAGCGLGLLERAAGLIGNGLGPWEFG